MKGNKVFTLVCLSSLIMGNIPYQPIHATTSTTDVKEEQSEEKTLVRIAEWLLQRI